MFKSTLAALAVAALSSSTSTPAALAASPSLSVQALQEGKIYYAKDVPEMKLAKAPAKAGTLDCRSKRTIPTWNNEEVVVCDSGLCKGAEAMPKLVVEDKAAPPRFSDAQLKRYMKALGVDSKIDGWMSHVHTWAANFLTLAQHERGIYGAVGELGVWQGKLFLGMAGFAHPEEPLLAADWFTNDSDKGYLKGFVDNVRRYLGAANLAKTLIFQGNTMALTPKWFADHKLPLFRMVSIDAGHSQECVLRDLNLIGCMIADGGVVIIDDFGFHVDSDWLGVNTAVYHFVLEQTRLVPFLYADNKLYLTTASHQEEYYNLLAKEDGVKCFKDGAEAGQFSLGNYKTCVFTSNFAYDCADAFLMRHRDDFRRKGIALRADDPEDADDAGGKGGKDEL